LAQSLHSHCLVVLLLLRHQMVVDGTPGTGNYYQAWSFLTFYE
jgi:hypothetical protein